MAQTKTKNKIALITGITGQDGSYLAELLLKKGYFVHGVVRRASTFNTARLSHIYQDPHVKNRKLFLHHGDLADAGTIRKIIYVVKPDEIYNLGAQSHVKVSFEIPEYTMDITGNGALRILEAIRDFQNETGKKIKFYQASSSEMFGSAPPPQNEKTPFIPQSPYGAAKVFAYNMTDLYRQAYGIFAVNGILFNHESERRGETFVTRKITRGIARIKAGLDKKLYLGNIDAKRDWGYAPEFCQAMWLMMQQPKPDDYVIGTGETHTVKEFVELAFKEAGLGNWKKYVEIDPQYYRPAEVNILAADTRKAKRILKWRPKTKFKDLVKIMVWNDINELKK
ncbi:MAG: GDP-mannose 4,6-dehydratase [Candidatus Yanofskybacteria bacterium RIFCSPHIGHO2_02_FULL_38_22b]|uniref:GDP-mannose 4,6-dehydratase n=1 Tax=Candidatus Yanofskybacteria bacterium RIFCSPHIGHO2_02_FULL_38_22b TaxID=1802673 RepID=A0A1F8F193_9BACT|nr:MAG: GDP-mannose 4,6-dehydratase [Candidatus Yanofskybacteria bacterium RIFCSPHIGHO2_01_FULL_39_44]OGN06911.1 MAG: GDP-mannose 4,6-dehydratase [Candidatus Yanofskybacteria bacterium RIFCSPHIGHO2_02_FULL_38_22b]OGN20685.1 MAG: GDP-mannose 4,6-dehydratase [Candidatus Yanofskybacteria bacterium RIFCSPLOWO2_01_FULL_39_28]